MARTEYPVDLSICVDCLFVLANGVESDDQQHAADAMTRTWGDTEITLGKLHDDCECGGNWEACDREDLGFSWRSCDGCGSDLGGDRYAATAWVTD